MNAKGRVPELHIFLTAGESSGDLLGARLMQALKNQYSGTLRFSGVGGKLMQEQGLVSLFPQDDLAVMGIAEVLPRLGLILKRIRQTAEAIVQSRPDIVITIDAPDFSFRVAKKVQALQDQAMVPQMVHYVAPTVWAWRPGRAAKIARLYDGIICLFAMEPSYFTAHGMKAVWAGHPVLERGFLPPDPEPATLGLLLGSRRGELRRMGSLFVEAARDFAARHPGTRIIAPTLPHIEDEVRALLAPLPCPVEIISDKTAKFASFARMRAALAVSGTAALELAVAKVPHIIGYRMNGLTWRVVRALVKVRFAHLANILLGRELVPEFIQGACSAENLAAGLESAWHQPQAQLAGFEELAGQLAGQDQPAAPSAQAAAFVLSRVKKN